MCYKPGILGSYDNLMVYSEESGSFRGLEASANSLSSESESVRNTFTSTGIKPNIDVISVDVIVEPRKKLSRDSRSRYMYVAWRIKKKHCNVAVTVRRVKGHGHKVHKKCLNHRMQYIVAPRTWHWKQDTKSNTKKYRTTRKTYN